METQLPLVAALALGLVVGALSAWFVAQARQAAGLAREASLAAQLEGLRRERDLALARADEIWADRDVLANEFKVLAHESLEQQTRRADESAELRQRATEHLLTPVRDSLERFNARLGDVEKERAALAADLSAQVQAVRATGEELRRETSALSTALRKPHVRGAWGELQLRRVVEVAGMVEHCDFVTQETSTSSDDRTIRPDLKVMLAGDRFVFVDSKVPLASFLDAQEATDERARNERLAAFARNLRTHVDALGAKSYFKAGPGSPEFVVLFLPSEALAAEALEHLPDLHEYAARRNVIIATPTTLIALLRSVAYGWRQAALSESASEVFALGRELYDRLGTLGGHIDKLGRSLNGAVRAYNVALGSLETRVLVTGRRLRDLQVSGAELASPAACEEVARPVTAPELVGDDEPPRLAEADLLTRAEPPLEELVREASTPPLPGTEAAG